MIKILGYIWKVITGIITIAVVLAIFSVASTSFESVVLAILVLIYLSVGSFSTIWALSHIEFAEALDGEIKDIKKLLNKDKTIDETNEWAINQREMEKADNDEYEKEARKEWGEKKKNIMIKFYINAGFQLIIYIITLFNLLKAFNS